MAMEEYIQRLQQGKAIWNVWRQMHLDETIDLTRADLQGADLSDVDLNSADLSIAKLSGVNLTRANISYTDFKGADLRGAILRGANLTGAILRGTDLTGAKFNISFLPFEEKFERSFEDWIIHTNLSYADLNGANLSDADLSGANLSNANFSVANLTDANLSYTDLTRAKLSNVKLNSSNLSRATLSDADLREAKVSATIFGDVDLRTVKHLETVRHEGPSYISTSTLSRSQGNIPHIFLRGAGLDDTFIDYIRSLTTHPIEYYTCFISYSSKDELFARRVHNDLQQEGVRCWFAPEDMDIGDKIRTRIEESIRLYDKLLLILSEHSIQSRWVAYEVEKALDKEPDGVPNVLYPVRLDQTILTCTESWAQDIKKTRHIGNFEDWTDPKQYQENFKRLLHALSAKKKTKN